MRAFAVAWDRKCYLKEGYEHLEDKEVYGQGPNDSLVFVNIIIKALEKNTFMGYFIERHFKLCFG